MVLDWQICLDTYWFLRHRVIEIPILERILCFLAPETCPIHFVINDPTRPTPEDIILLHGGLLETDQGQIDPIGEWLDVYGPGGYHPELDRDDWSDSALDSEELELWFNGQLPGADNYAGPAEADAEANAEPEAEPEAGPDAPGLDW